MALFTSSNPSKKKKQVYLAKFTTKKSLQRRRVVFFPEPETPPLRQVRQVRQVRQTKKRPFGTVSGQFCVVSFCLTCLNCLNFSAGLIRKQQICRFCVRLTCLTCISCSKTSKSTGFVFVSLVPFLSHLSHLLKNRQIGRFFCLSHLSLVSLVSPPRFPTRSHEKPSEETSCFFPRARDPPLRQVRQVRQVRQTKKRPSGIVFRTVLCGLVCLTCLNCPNISAKLLTNSQFCRFCV